MRVNVPENIVFHRQPIPSLGERIPTRHLKTSKTEALESLTGKADLPPGHCRAFGKGVQNQNI